MSRPILPKNHKHYMATTASGSNLSQRQGILVPEQSFLGNKQEERQESLGDTKSSSRNTEGDRVEDEDNFGLPPVDGKEAWCVGMGSFLLALPIAISFCIGVMQDYYQRENVFPEPNSQVKLTIVGILLQGVIFSFNFLTNILFSFVGERRLLIVGTIMMVAGLVLSGTATAVWHLYLTLSLCSGTGIACMLTIAFRILPNWFVKYRSTAFGIQTGVVQLAAFIMPYLMLSVNRTLGPAWTYRILGLLFCVTNGIALTVIRDRRPFKKIPGEWKKTVDFTVLKNFNLILWIIVHPIQLYATYLAFTYLPLHATAIGLSDLQGATLVSILAGSDFIGRILVGVIADRFGNVNTFIICMMISTLAIWVVWVFATTFIALVAFAAMNGLVSGSFAVVVAPVTFTIVGPKGYPSAAGLRTMLMLAAVFGPFLAAHLESINHTGEPYLYAKLIAGVGTTTACLLSLWLKFRMDNRLHAKT
ncbi:major facilitator superfamily domain-containing protein [Fennellomyces sp. T-0311]|nr:major facilitator superfamily domain-containing protein [Fennellomyces sp. T-0311]